MKFAFFLLLCAIGGNVVAQDTVQAQLLGKYKFPSGSVVEEVIVLFENGGLMMNSSAGTSVLELLKGDSFNVVSFNGTAVFKRNDAKKVIGVHIDASGYVLDGVKDVAAIKASFYTTNPQTLEVSTSSKTAPQMPATTWHAYDPLNTITLIRTR